LALYTKKSFLIGKLLNICDSLIFIIAVIGNIVFGGCLPSTVCSGECKQLFSSHLSSMVPFPINLESCNFTCCNSDLCNDDSVLEELTDSGKFFSFCVEIIILV